MCTHTHWHLDFIFPASPPETLQGVKCLILLLFFLNISPLLHWPRKMPQAWEWDSEVWQWEPCPGPPQLGSILSLCEEKRSHLLILTSYVPLACFTCPSPLGAYDGSPSEDHFLHRRHWEHCRADGPQTDAPFQLSRERGGFSPIPGWKKTVQDDLPCLWVWGRKAAFPNLPLGDLNSH